MVRITSDVTCNSRYPDRIPQDKIPQDKIPTDKIPQDRIPQDKIPQPEKWTKSHNIESWQGDGFKLLVGATDSGRGHPWRTGKSWCWSLRTWLVSHLGSESDASTSVCRLASSRSVRIASLAAGQSMSSWPASGTTYAGRPVTDTRNRGQIWLELCRMNKLYKLCVLNHLNKFRTNYCE